MEVVGMSDICETLKKHETTLPFLTLNLTFGVYGYQIDTAKILTCGSSFSVGCNVESESTSINFSYLTKLNP